MPRCRRLDLELTRRPHSRDRNAASAPPLPRVCPDVPATGRLDMHLVQAAVGDRHARLATEEELRRDFPGIELGALPPLGSLLGRPLFVDQEVQHETVVFAAGSQTESAQPGYRLTAREA